MYEEEISQLPEILVDKVQLLPEMLFQSRALSTNTKYRSAFVRFQNWALNNGMDSKDTLPARPLTVALYLSSLIQSSNSPSPIITAFYAIKWFHDMLGLVSPTESKLNLNVLEAAKRILSTTTHRKEPIDIGILTRLYDNMYMENNAKNQRIICAFLLGFAGFLRSSELLNIKVSDIIFQDAYMSIFIESSKTDKYREGAWVLIAKTNTKLCPVSNVKKLLNWCKFLEEDYLFCNLCLTKEGYKIRKSNKRMSYSNLRDLFLQALKPLVKKCKDLRSSFFKVWWCYCSCK